MQPLDASSPTPRAGALPWEAIGLLALFAVLAASVAFQLGWTTDEPNYVDAGRLQCWNGSWEDELARNHGPLVYYASQLFLGEVPPVRLAELDAQPLAGRARLGLLPFALLAGVLLWRWTRACFGRGAATLALGLFVGSPVILAHGALATADMALCAAALWALEASWRFACEPTWRRWCIVGLALGLALCAKHSGLFLMAVVPPCVAWGLARGPGSVSTRLVRALAGAVGVVLLAVVILFLAYGPAVGFASAEPTAYGSALLRGVTEHPLARWLVALLPRPYAQGLDFQLVASTQFRGS